MIHARTGTATQPEEDNVDHRADRAESALTRVLRLSAQQARGAYLRVDAWDRTLMVGAAGSSAVTTTVHDGAGAVFGQLGVWPGDGPVPQQLVDDAAHLCELIVGHALGATTDDDRDDARYRPNALTDESTGLPTWAALRAELAAGDDARGALLLLGLDRFGLVEDALGEGASGMWLAELARRLRITASTGSMPGPAITDTRLAVVGHDTFVAFLPHRADGGDASVLGERLVATARRPITVAGRVIALSGCVGIASLTSTAPEHVERAFEEADAALHKAKAQGRSRVAAFDDSLRRELSRALDVESELREALSLDELSVAFQPEIDLLTGRVVGLEALARWSRPTGEAVPPSEFIAIAEDSGLVAELDAHVLRTALREFARRPSLGNSADGEDVVLWVNCSALNLNERLATTVRHALELSGVPAHRLGLEIPEGALVGDLTQAREALAETQALGVRLAIDDFGTGTASFTVLTTLDADVVKIDKSFIDPLDRDASSEMIIRAAIALAHARGMTVVAEGVETHEQAARLYRLGCDAAQGYLWARPGSMRDADGAQQDRLAPSVTSPLGAAHSRLRRA